MSIYRKRVQEINITAEKNFLLKANTSCKTSKEQQTKPNRKLTAESREPRPRNSLSLRFKIENQQRAKTTGREQTLPSLIKPLGRSAVGARQRCLAPATSRKRYEGHSYRGQRPGLSIFLFFICFLLLVFRPHTQKLQFCSLLYPQYQQTISPVSEGTTGWRSVLPKKHTTHDGRRRLKHESLPNLFLRAPSAISSN